MERLIINGIDYDNKLESALISTKLQTELMVQIRSVSRFHPYQTAGSNTGKQVHEGFLSQLVKMADDLAKLKTKDDFMSGGPNYMGFGTEIELIDLEDDVKRRFQQFEWLGIKIPHHFSPITDISIV